MQFTAEGIITDALREIGALASNDLGGPGAPTTQELTDGLNSLNKLVDRWSMLGILILQIVEYAQALSGFTGPFALARPAKIKAARCLSGTLSAPVEICSAEQWTEIVDESRSGKFATKMFIDYQWPTSNFWVWPAATGTLYLYYFTPLAQWPDIDTTSINLPPGYALGLTLNLAVELAEQYGRPVTQSLLKDADQARMDIQMANAKIFGSDPAPDQPLPQAPGKPAGQAA
jgi:hypothetical protein